MMTPQQFAAYEYRGYCIYRSLAAIETNSTTKEILERLSRQEKEHSEFWSRLSGQNPSQPNALRIFFVMLTRRAFGLTFTIKLLEKHEHVIIQHYHAYLHAAPEELKSPIRALINEETIHEREMIGHIKEETVEFMGNIILGLNDGLIELTGALVGFASVFNNNTLVGFTGFIVGVSASLSMAASAYMQARQEKGKSPRKAAGYTGIAYIIVVLLLVSSFFTFDDVIPALLMMFGIVFSIIALTSYYVSVIFERQFRAQFGEMFLFSVGVSTISFLIGTIFRLMTGVKI